MTATENHSAKNLVNVRASMSRRKTLATLRKARAALAARRAEAAEKLARKQASAAKARETLAWQRKMGITS